MGLDSLLASLKAGVSEGSATSEVSGDTVKRLPDTPDTSAISMGYQREPSPAGACTPDTSDTPKIIKSERKTKKAGGSSHQWANTSMPQELSLSWQHIFLEVSEVSGVQASHQAAKTDTPVLFSEVSGVSGSTAEPLIPTNQHPLPLLTTNEEAAIWAWLARIEETDPVIVAEVMERCQRDAEARAYFIGQAMERLRPVLSVELSYPVQERPVEVRRRCADCCHSRPIEGDEPGAIQRCVVNENGIGYFAFQRHRCEWWDA